MQRKIIDLTHLLSNDISVYPDTVGPEIEVLNTVEDSGFAELKMSMVLHSGTHIDAPCHILRGAKSLDEFPVEKFVGRGVVIPCHGAPEISLALLRKSEDEIRRSDFVLLFTGWQDKWRTAGYASNCPIPTPEAAQWLAEFDLKGIGIDSFSVDYIVPASSVTDDNLPNHHIFLGREILLIENLTNLDKLPAAEFMFQCLPLNIEQADGSPVRAIAIVDL